MDVKKKIYLIDDTPDQNRIDFPNLDFVGADCFVQIRELQLSKDNKVDRDILERIESEGCAILYHKSFRDRRSDFGSSSLYRFEIESLDMPRIGFSAGETDNEFDEDENFGSMKKGDLYASLPRFLEHFERTGEADLKGLAEGDYLPGKEVAEVGNVILFEGREKFKSYLDSASDSEKEGLAVAFDMDAMSAEKVRYEALFIRLSRDTYRKDSFVPFIFFGSKPELDYVKEFAEKSSADILLCGGSKLLGETTLEDVKSRFGELKIEALTEGNFRKDFLDNVKVNPVDEKTGNHTIANHWGAYQLGSYILKASEKQLHGDVRTNLEKHLEEVTKNREPLYLKYLLAQRRSLDEVKSEGRGGLSSKNVQNVVLPDCRGKKILCIDDQDKEWRPVFQALFSGADLTIKGKTDLGKAFPGNDFSNRNIERFLHGVDVVSFDLVLLDMRLKGDEEEHEQGKDLSGLKVLTKIMEMNRGVRVIMFTSSNKVWNLSYAVQTGAAGYYIKESPEIAISESDSIQSCQNLFDLIADSFQQEYLRLMVEDVAEIQNYKLNWRPRYFLRDIGEEKKKERIEKLKEYWEDMKAQLGIALRMIFNASVSKELTDFEYAFVSLEQVFESLKPFTPWDNSSTIILVKNVAEWNYINFEDHKTEREEKDVYEIIRHYVELRNHIVHRDDVSRPSDSVTLLEKYLLPLWDFIVDLMGRMRYQQKN